MDLRGKIVLFLEGNIASGKSALLDLINDKYHDQVVVVYEPLETWQNYKGRFNLLNLMYQDFDKNAIPFQIIAQISQLSREKEKTNFEKKFTFFERSIASQLIFIEHLHLLGKIREVDYFILQDLYTAMEPLQEPLNRKTCYLRTSPETCLKRIKMRGRVEEKNIDLLYLQGLHNLHERRFNTTNCVVLNGDNNNTTVFAEAEEIIFRNKTFC